MGIGETLLGEWRRNGGKARGASSGYMTLSLWRLLLIIARTKTICLPYRTLKLSVDGLAQGSLIYGEQLKGLAFGINKQASHIRIRDNQASIIRLLIESLYIYDVLTREGV